MFIFKKTRTVDTPVRIAVAYTARDVTRDRARQKTKADKHDLQGMAPRQRQDALPRHRHSYAASGCHRISIRCGGAPTGRPERGCASAAAGTVAVVAAAAPDAEGWRVLRRKRRARQPRQRQSRAAGAPRRCNRSKTQASRQLPGSGRLGLLPLPRQQQRRHPRQRLWEGRRGGANDERGTCGSSGRGRQPQQCAVTTAAPRQSTGRGRLRLLPLLRQRRLRRRRQPRGGGGRGGGGAPQAGGRAAVAAAAVCGSQSTSQQRQQHAG